MEKDPRRRSRSAPIRVRAPPRSADADDSFPSPLRSSACCRRTPRRHRTCRCLHDLPCRRGGWTCGRRTRHPSTTPETQVALAVERPAVLAVVRRGQRRTSLVSALTKGVCITEGCCVMAPCCRQCHNDAKVSNDQYRCDGPAICRTGGADSFFHCDKCGCCYNNVTKDSHCCVKRAMHPNFPVCFEDKEHEKAAKAEVRGNEQEVPAKRNDDVCV